MTVHRGRPGDPVPTLDEVCERTRDVMDTLIDAASDLRTEVAASVIDGRLGPGFGEYVGRLREALEATTAWSRQFDAALWKAAREQTP